MNSDKMADICRDKDFERGMNELAKRITDTIRNQQKNRLALTIGKVMTFNGTGRLNKFVNVKVTYEV